MTQGKNSAFKAGIGYTIGNILIKGINFLSVPFFSRVMTTSEFGVYNVFVSYDAILSVVVGLALHSSVRSASYEFKDEIDKYTSSLTLIYILNAIILLGVVLLLRVPLLKILGLESGVMLLLIPFSFGGAIIQLYNEKVSLTFSYKKYLAVAFVNSISNLVVSVIFIFTIFNEHRDIGRILGATVTIFALSIIIIVNLYKKEKPRFVKKYWKFGIKYSLPVVPHGISQVLLANFDKIMISNMIGDDKAGIYSLAGNIKLILTVISSSISTAWATWFYSKIEKKETAEIQKRSVQLCELFTIFTIGLIAISPEIIYILGGREYAEARYIAIPMILDAFVLFIYNIIVPSEYYTKKTTYIMWGTIGAAIINIITNYIFIINYGYLAAAYTTLFAYICYDLFHAFISYNLVGFFVIPLKNVIIYSILEIIIATVCLILVDNIIVRIVICFIAVMILMIHLLVDYMRSKIKKEIV